MKYITLLIVLFSLYSCSNNDYLIDGGLANQNVGMSTYDFLKSHKQLDTLAILIEKADMIAAVNAQSTTLFAPNNLVIKNYILYMRDFTDNPTYGIADLPVDELKTMLGGYIINERLDRSKLKKEGEIYTALNGEERRISLRPFDQYSGQLDQLPEYVFFTYKKDTWDPIDELKDDYENMVRTSNLISTNGVIHVLQGNHRFNNYTPN